MNRLFACILLSALAAYSLASPYEDCGSDSGQVSAVEVSDCADGQDTCTLKKGTQAQITIKFNSKTDTKSLKAVVHGVISGVPIPFPLPNPDACKAGVSCPVKSGESYTYSDKLDIKTSYPPVSVKVRYELKGENDDDLVCVEIPCQIS
uniref:NPC2-4 n=1 Tax=Pardosa pseudoannulata TaxID=330961 RepID=A0A411AIS1_9ARAC|nr:NPC2-4 [Pardosa pseudoannulata]